MEIHTIGGSRRRGEDMAVDMYIRARGRTKVEFEEDDSMSPQGFERRHLAQK